MSNCIRTRMATDSSEPRLSWRLASLLLRPLLASPHYEKRLYLVREWLIEFHERLPVREVGLGSNGEPVVAGPDRWNFGFWTDTDLKWEDFEGDEIGRDVFEAAWSRWATNGKWLSPIENG